MASECLISAGAQGIRPSLASHLSYASGSIFGCIIESVRLEIEELQVIRSLIPLVLIVIHSRTWNRNFLLIHLESVDCTELQVVLLEFERASVSLCDSWACTRLNCRERSVVLFVDVTARSDWRRS